MSAAFPCSTRCRKKTATRFRAAVQRPARAPDTRRTDVVNQAGTLPAAASGSVQRARRLRRTRGIAAVDLDVASNLAALFDHQLAVADLARDFAGRVNHE